MRVPRLLLPCWKDQLLHLKAFLLAAGFLGSKVHSQRSSHSIWLQGPVPTQVPPQVEPHWTVLGLCKTVLSTTSPFIKRDWSWAECFGVTWVCHNCTYSLVCLLVYFQGLPQLILDPGLQTSQSSSWILTGMDLMLKQLLGPAKNISHWLLPSSWMEDINAINLS